MYPKQYSISQIPRLSTASVTPLCNLGSMIDMIAEAQRDHNTLTANLHIIMWIRPKILDKAWEIGGAEAESPSPVTKVSTCS